MNPIAQCRQLARHTEEPGYTTRTFLSEPMREVHRELALWMREAGMSVSLDAAGNLRGHYPGSHTGDGAPVLYVGSHLDTVPRAGAFDGVLGVVLGVNLVHRLRGRRFRFALEVLGFSEEEGVRFGFPFIGSLALTGELGEAALARVDRAGVTVADAIRHFGLDPEAISRAVASDRALGYLEFHIEQGPVLETLGLSLGVVDSLVGQSRLEFRFEGQAGHAGTTPMRLRRDALAGAAEWILAVEKEGVETPGLVATTGRIEALPGAPNVIASEASVTLDVRHPEDRERHAAVRRLTEQAESVAARRGLRVTAQTRLDQPAVALDPGLGALLAKAVESTGSRANRMCSGAGHDAMILARRMPAAMLFLRSPGGISHHPDETVLEEDVARALAVGLRFLEQLEQRL